MMAVVLQQLLTPSSHDAEILRCVGASQETTVKERVAFLRMAEEGDYAKRWEVDKSLLGDMA